MQSVYDSLIIHFTSRLYQSIVCVQLVQSNIHFKSLSVFETQTYQNKQFMKAYPGHYTQDRQAANQTFFCSFFLLVFFW